MKIHQKEYDPKVTETDIDRSATVFTTSEINRDMSKIANFPQPCLTSLLREFPCNFVTVVALKKLVMSVLDGRQHLTTVHSFQYNNRQICHNNIVLCMHDKNVSMLHFTYVIHHILLYSF